MTTQLISLNEYRKNLSSLWKKSREENIKYIVMVHSEPVFEVKPITQNNFNDDWTEYTEENHQAYLKAEEDLKNGETIDFSDFLGENGFDKLKKEYEGKI